MGGDEYEPDPTRPDGLFTTFKHAEFVTLDVAVKHMNMGNRVFFDETVNAHGSNNPVKM